MKEVILIKRLILAITLMLLIDPIECLASADNLVAPVVSKTCGGAEMSLRCTPSSNGKLDCLHPTLTLKDRDDHISKMATPLGMEAYSPKGLACSVSTNDHHNYFVVEYGELPAGCEYCEWLHIYDTHGKLLTSSNPPIQIVEGMKPPRDKAPNNNEFDALRKKLGLVKFNEEYFQAVINPPSGDAALDAIEKKAPISVPGIPNGVLKSGMDYADFRREILAKGWTPVVDVKCKTNVDDGEKSCNKMPELSTCSVDGYCLMHFRLTGTNKNMDVNTYGDLTGWDIQAKDSQLAVTGATISTQ